MGANRYRFKVWYLGPYDQRILNLVEAYSEKQAVFLTKKKHGFHIRVLRVEVEKCLTPTLF